MSDTQPSDPEPKIYAPLLVQLESDYPALAPRLIGIGDSPLPYDHRKIEVTAHFETEAGTRFSGKYHTDVTSSTPDAREFLARMDGKFKAALATDQKVLEAPPAPVPVVGTEPSPPSAPLSGPLLPDEDVDAIDDDPEPVTEAEPVSVADDADWNSPKDPEPIV
jgi:hypothetical protein